MSSLCPHTWVKLDQQTRETLHAYRAKTGVGACKLLKNACNVPPGLSSRTIDNWLQGAVKKVRHDHLDYVFKEWEKWPQHEFAEITAEIQATLLHYKNQSGLGPQALLRGARNEQPQGLSSQQILTWLSGTPKQVRKDHLDYVLNKWKTLASNEKQRIPITEDILQELKFHRRRSTVEPKQLLIRAENIPHSLSAGMIHQWFNQQTKTARKGHLEFVLQEWKNAPNSTSKPICPASEVPCDKQGMVEITDTIRNRLHAYRDLTSVGPIRLLQRECDGPIELTASVVDGWLRGETTTAPAAHLNYVLNKWKRLTSNSGDRVTLTDETLKTLKMYRKSGVLPGQIFRNAHEVPNGLSPGLIGSWFTGNTLTARRDHLDYVLSRCKELEAHAYRRIQITDKMLNVLRSHQKRTGIGVRVLFKAAQDIPEELSPGMIANWLSKTTTTARKDHWDYVLRMWKQTPDA